MACFNLLHYALHIFLSVPTETGLVLSKASVPFVRHILVGTAFCALCFPVSLALIKYLCFHAELLTLLPQLVSSCPVSDDICTSVTQHHRCLSAFSASLASGCAI